jgi:diamine N-acetyltransferase
MVGFYSFIYYPGRLHYCAIGGFLIDKAHQGKGYGRAALAAFIAFVQRQHPECCEIYLTVHPRNTVAAQLYNSLGFVKTGNVIEREEVMRLLMAGPASR